MPQHSVYTVRVDFENKPSDAEETDAERQRLHRMRLGYSFARFMHRMRQDYLERVAVEDAAFLRGCGISAT